MYGVFDRALARRPISAEHYRAHLPPLLRFVAVRKSQPASWLDMFQHYLPGLQPALAPTPPGLEGWKFYELTPHDASHPLSRREPAARQP